MTLVLAYYNQIRDGIIERTTCIIMFQRPISTFRNQSTIFGTKFFKLKVIIVIILVFREFQEISDQ